ncbi:MAG: alpha/beta fold hydrolase [Myxococcales bacterium]
MLLLRPLGGSMSLWGAFADRLAESFRVVLFDPRGVGTSSPAPERLTIEDMAADAGALLDHLRVRRLSVFGLSLGGMVAQRLALTRPGQLERMVLASTVARGLDFTGAGVRRGLRFAACLAGPAPESAVCLATRVLSRRFRREQPERAASILRSVAAEAPSTRALWAMLGAAAGFDARRELRRLTMPVLVLNGSEDRLVSAAAQAELVHALPAGCFDVVERCGHDLSLEKPMETAERVAAFFSAR